MNKNQIDKLVEGLGGEIISGEANKKKTRIGDVLEKIREKYPTSWENHYDNLIYFWAWCQKNFEDKKSLSKSLQGIFACGWEEVPCDCHNSGIAPCSMCEQYGGKSQRTEQLKDPNARVLAEFINQLDL